MPGLLNATLSTLPGRPDQVNIQMSYEIIDHHGSRGSGTAGTAAVELVNAGRDSALH